MWSRRLAASSLLKVWTCWLSGACFALRMVDPASTKTSRNQQPALFHRHAMTELGIRLKDHLRYDVSVSVRDRHNRVRDAKLIRHFARPAGEQKFGFSAFLMGDFHIKPADPPGPSGAQRLEGRFFRSKAGSIAFRPVLEFLAVSDLGRSEDLSCEPVAMPFQSLSNSLCLGNVNACANSHPFLTLTGDPAEFKPSRAPCYIQTLATRNFNLISSNALEWIECGALAGMPWLVHAFGTRRGGGLAPGPRGKDPARNWNNGTAASAAKSRHFFKALGAEQFALAAIHQTHSALIYRVSQSSARGRLRYQPAGDVPSGEEGSPHPPAGDALITDQPGILLSVRTADCVPVLLVDRERRAIAAVHAGWRGALARIIQKAAGEMHRMFHSRPESLMAAIGPSIRGCCYEVGPEVADAFIGAFPAGEEFLLRLPATPEETRMAQRYQTLFALQSPPGHQSEQALAKVHLNLAAAVSYQLEQAGVPSRQIYVADYCTACRTDLFYSYRKEGALAGRMITVIGMQPPA